MEHRCYPPSRLGSVSLMARLHLQGYLAAGHVLPKPSRQRGRFALVDQVLVAHARGRCGPSGRPKAI